VKDLVRIAQTGGALIHKPVRAVPATLDSGTKHHIAAAVGRAECTAAADFVYILQPGCALVHEPARAVPAGSDSGTKHHTAAEPAVSTERAVLLVGHADLHGRRSARGSLPGTVLQGLLSELLELPSPCFLTLSLPSASGGLDDDMSPYASGCDDVDDVDEERKMEETGASGWLQVGAGAYPDGHDLLPPKTASNTKYI